MKKNWLILVAAIALSLALIAVWIKQTIDQICFSIKFGALDVSSVNINWGYTASGTAESTVNILFLNKSNLSVNFKVLLVEIYHASKLVVEVKEEQDISLKANSVSEINVPVVLTINSGSASALMSYFSGEDLEIQYLVRLSFFGIPFNVIRTRTINKMDAQTQCT